HGARALTLTRKAPGQHGCCQIVSRSTQLAFSRRCAIVGWRSGGVCRIGSRVNSPCHVESTPTPPRRGRSLTPPRAQTRDHRGSGVLKLRPWARPGCAGDDRIRRAAEPVNSMDMAYWARVDDEIVQTCLERTELRSDSGPLARG